MAGAIVSAAYDARIAQGMLKEDAAQRRALPAFDALARQVADEGGSRFGRLLGRFGRRPEPAHRNGIYLVGKVGRGKTMLMDLFHESVPVARKRRVHFNAFMQDIHARIHAVRQSRHEADVVAPVAAQVIEETRLLCLDEFQVQDIADAMLLGRLFEALFAGGMATVLTSNTEPDRLYEDGLNRQLFLPFIDLIKARLDIVVLAGARDYRLSRIAGEKAYVHPLSAKADAHVEKLWSRLTDGAEGSPMALTVKARKVHIPRAARSVARAEFADLCQKPLGPADYLAIAEAFETVFIEHVPRLDKVRADAARRFTTLIDILYDARVRLVMSAEAPPNELAPETADFSRTASRLTEMQNPDYASATATGRA